MERNQLVEYRELFLTLAETTDEMIALEDKESKGEQIDENEVNLLLGKFMANIFKLQAIGNE